MPLVLLKNFLFPRGSETQPLLPTTYLATDQAIAKPPLDISLPPSNYCSRKDCPKYPRRDSECSEASSTTATDTPSSSSSRNSKHWFDARTISDAIIGLSDGLTVPFALTAGLSAFNDTRVVIFGGCAELIAGSISMGLGGWLAGRGEAYVPPPLLHLP